VTAPAGSGVLAAGPDVGRPLGDRFAAALSFQDFLAGATANIELWRALYARARPTDAAVARATAVGGQWSLLVLAEDWCGDAVNTVPALARLAERAPNIDLRILQRDANLDIMDAHLTLGSRSIPVVIVLDAAFRERGWWGPRPRALQSWVIGEGRALAKEDRYREVRRWYARDHGATTVDDVVSLIESAASAPLPGDARLAGSQPA
jgi:hypothetical protein